TTGRSRADNQWGTPKTSAEMKQQATFTDWDFATIWKIKEGSTYPALQWEEQAKGKAEIFTDLGGVPWAKLPIEVLASKDMLKGITGTEYAPNEHITRGDFLYSLVRTLGAAADFTGNFADVKEEAYYYKEIGIARELGMAVGTGENKFDPDASLTRQDMWVLAARGLTQLEKLEGQGTASNLDRFADKDQVADYAVNSIASLVREKLIGVSEDRINPQDKVTRAEAAVFLFQLYIRY
ncbi:MAG: S-layer homology domain-containing protein, partial [bacterium]